MTNYIGSRCIVCNEKFNKDDDVVVCPDCGTPYHRDCYKKSGKCVNTALHESHKSWAPSYDVGDPAEKYTEEVLCDKCGNKNPPMTLFCEKCGSPLNTLEEHNESMRVKAAPLRENTEKEYNKTNGMLNIGVQPFLINFSDPLCGLNPEEDYDGVRLCELADYIESNTHYYVPIFKRIKETGKAMTWNFAAMLFPEFFFANRKMPLMAVAVFLVRIVTLIPRYLTSFAALSPEFMDIILKYVDLRSSAFQSVTILSTVLTYGLMFFCGAYANWFYYKQAVKKTKKIKNSTSPFFLRDTLKRKGGTSVALLLIAGFIWVTLMYLCSLFMSQFLGV